MEFSIVSNMTKEGTIVTIDGKKLKNIDTVEFDLYEKTLWSDSGPSMPSSAIGEVPVICTRVTTKEEAEDGTCKRVEYSFRKEGEKEGVLDSKEIKIDDKAIIDEITNKMLGHKSIF